MTGPIHMAENTCHGLDEGELQVAVRDLLRQETLIIRGELTEPPTWFPSFRELTMRLEAQGLQGGLGQLAIPAQQVVQVMLGQVVVQVILHYF